MNFFSYWWETISEGFHNFSKKIGLIGYGIDIIIALVISFLVGDGFYERVVLLIASSLIVFIILGLLYSFLFQPFINYKYIKSEIDKFAPNFLNISVGPALYKGDVGDQSVFLYIISHEEKKILDLRAKKQLLCQRDSSTNNDSRGNEFGSLIPNFHFSWSNGCDIVELLPGAQDELEVAKIFDSQKMYPEFGLPKIKPPNSDKPSIYDFEIRFIGKLEGETSYSLFDYRGEILYIPNSFYPTFKFIEHLSDVPEELQNKVFSVSKVN